MLVPAGWQETKKSPASRLAGDLAFKLSLEKITKHIIFILSYMIAGVLYCFYFFFSDFLFKFLVIGSAGTGKSCILHQFIENKCEYP